VSEFETGVTKCWTEDEWSRGAWAFAGLNPAAYTPEGRVHFAGEHLSMWFSWMQGALDSSQRAVKQILDAG
jgi:monoamine oxidase